MQFDTKDLDPDYLCTMCEERMRRLIKSTTGTSLDDVCELCNVLIERENQEEAAHDLLLADCQTLLYAERPILTRKEALLRILNLIADPPPGTEDAHMAHRIARDAVEHIERGD
jgi:hypothetical protein